MTLPVLQSFPPQVCLIPSLEPADKVLLQIWGTASPESQGGGKWAGPGDVLLTTPTVVKLAEIKPWARRAGIQKALEEDPKVVFGNQ